MYVLIDILVIAFVLGFAIYGLKVGFFGSAIDFALVLICIGGAAFLSYITVMKVYVKWGWVEESYQFFLRLLGDSKIPGGQQYVELAAYYIALGLLILLTFIVYDIALHLIRKLILKISGGVRKCKGIKVFDNILGFLVNTVLAAGAVLVILAFFHAFDDSELLFKNTVEAIRSTEIIGKVYDFNPLNDIIANTGIAQTMQDSLAKLTAK